jgi:hypothetical protein
MVGTYGFKRGSLKEFEGANLKETYQHSYMENDENHEKSHLDGC